MGPDRQQRRNPGHEFQGRALLQLDWGVGWGWHGDGGRGGEGGSVLRGRRKRVKQVSDLSG